MNKQDLIRKAVKVYEEDHIFEDITSEDIGYDDMTMQELLEEIQVGIRRKDGAGELFEIPTKSEIRRGLLNGERYDTVYDAWKFKYKGHTYCLVQDDYTGLMVTPATEKGRI